MCVSYFLVLLHNYLWFSNLIGVSLNVRHGAKRRKCSAMRTWVVTFSSGSLCVAYPCVHNSPHLCRVHWWKAKSFDTRKWPNNCLGKVHLQYSFIFLWVDRSDLVMRGSDGPSRYLRRALDFFDTSLCRVLAWGMCSSRISLYISSPSPSPPRSIFISISDGCQVKDGVKDIFKF